MSTLLQKLFLFSIPILIFLIVIGIGLDFIPNTYDIKKKLLEKNPQKIEFIFFGTSHSFSGINPTNFKTNSINIANNSQSIYYDLKILDKYLNKLENLKVVFFEINFFTFKYNLDKGPEAFRNKYYFQSFDLEPQTDNLTFLDKIRLRHLSNDEILILLKNYYITKNYENTNGFAQNDIGPKILNDSDIISKFKSFKFEYVNSNSSEILPLFSTIYKKLKEKNVRVVFVQLPVRKKLCHLINDEINNSAYFSTFESIVQQSNDCFLDYLCDDRFDDSLFVDSDHLTTNGANIFTKLLLIDFESCN